jgi:transcriptional regulator with XRE-family HTH domain
MKSRTRKTPRITELSEKLGTRVASLRMKREWTQVDLATAAGMGQGFVSRIEAGTVEPCLGVLDALATAFDMTVSELLKGI